MSPSRAEWMRSMVASAEEPDPPELDPLVEFGGLALDAVHKAREELQQERAVSRFLAETLATEGKWTTERWLDAARIAVDPNEDDAADIFDGRATGFGYRPEEQG